jgi:hypothetical protein
MNASRPLDQLGQRSKILWSKLFAVADVRPVKLPRCSRIRYIHLTYVLNNDGEIRPHLLGESRQMRAVRLMADSSAGVAGKRRICHSRHTRKADRLDPVHSA